MWGYVVSMVTSKASGNITESETESVTDNQCMPYWKY